MRRLVVLALGVPLVAGCGWFGGWAPYPGSSTHTAQAVAVAPAAERVRHWVKVEHLRSKALPGAKLFATAGCTACHTYAGAGSSNLGAPDLTAIGSRHLGIGFEIRHLRCPSCVNPGSPMPMFRSLGPKRLRELAVFLEASKGTH